MNAPAQSLIERRAALQAAEPRLYPRDIAARLGVTEADLLALDEGSADPARRTTRLRPDWHAILGTAHTLGPVMALTRNADAVHEKTAAYGPIEGEAHVALFLGEIDLRLFLGVWRFGWAVGAPDSTGRRSLQFFGAEGAAVHKIFATDATDRAAWNALVDRFAATDLPPPQVAAPAIPAAPLPDAEIDAAGLLAGWDGLQDTHEFFGLLRRFKVARTQAFRLAGPARARPVAAASLRQVLQHSSAADLPIMVFVGNPGCIQIHTGPVHSLREAGPWPTCSTRNSACATRPKPRSTPPGSSPSRPATGWSPRSSCSTPPAARSRPCSASASGQPEDLAWRELCAELTPRPISQHLARVAALLVALALAQPREGEGAEARLLSIGGAVASRLPRSPAKAPWSAPT